MSIRFNFIWITSFVEMNFDVPIQHCKDIMGYLGRFVKWNLIRGMRTNVNLIASTPRI